jgi:autotransporter adhesin
MQCFSSAAGASALCLALACCINPAAAGSLDGGVATGSHTVAIGSEALANGEWASSLGYKAKAEGVGASAVGSLAEAVGPRATAFGHESIAHAARSVALGVSSKAHAERALVVGSYSEARAQYAAALGNRAVASGISAIAAGNGAASSATDAIALGRGASALHFGAVALGAGSITGPAVATHSAMIAGKPYRFAGSTPASTVSIGSAGAERTLTHLAAGRLDGSSTDAVNGSQLNATHQEVTAMASQVSHLTRQVDRLFNGATSTSQERAARSNSGDADDARLSLATTSRGIVVANAEMEGRVAAGPAAVASGARSVAMGSDARAEADNSVAIGAGSVAERTGTVAVGRAGQERTISHVAAGGVDTDAVNVHQLRSGVDQAVSRSQAYTDARLDSFGNEMWALDQRVHELRRDMEAGVAASMGLKQAPLMPGKTTYYAGVGGYRDQAVLGVSLRRTANSGRWSIEGGVSGNRRGAGGYVGVSGALQ